MNNYKIRVNNEAESREAQELFFELGYGWTNEFEKKVTTSQDAIDEGYSSNYQISFIYAEKDGRLLHDTNDQDAYKSFVESTAKELTLPQLRDLVAQSKSNEQGLISGEEAYKRIGERIEVEAYVYQADGSYKWEDAKHLPACDILNDGFDFRLKPRTVKLSLDIPVCGKNYKYGQLIWVLNSLEPNEYCSVMLDESDELPAYWWATEADIKIVVEQLRKLKEHSK